MEPIDVNVRVDELDQFGRLLLDAARRQSPHFRAILTEENGEVIVTLRDDPDSDDALYVSLRSQITHIERARRFGLMGLERHQWHHFSKITGFPVPSESHLAELERIIGPWYDEMRYYMDESLIRRWQWGSISAAEALNMMGARVMALCERGHWEVA